MAFSGYMRILAIVYNALETLKKKFFKLLSKSLNKTTIFD